MLKKQLSRVKKAELSPQLSALKSQLSALSSQLSSLNSQLSALSPQLSTINYQLSSLNYQLSTLSPQLSALKSLSKRCRPRRAVSRILSAARRSVWLCVHLSTPPKRSSRRSEMRHTRNHRRAARFPILPCTGMGLSSLHCYLWSGELLPPLFTLTSDKPEAVIFCDTIRHARLPSRAPAFTGIPALRCPDFPLIPKGTSERPHAEVDGSNLPCPSRKRKR